MKDLHVKVHKQLEKINEPYAKRVNNGTKFSTFEEGD